MRIQLDVADNTMGQIKRIMDEAHIRTYSELFSNALAMVNWAVKEAHAGRIIVSADPSTRQAVTQLAMPLLDAVQRPQDIARPKPVTGD